MRKTFITSSLSAAALFSFVILQPSSLHAQGALTPPGAPAPTMKTLAQIEARTPVDATNTPGTSTAQFNITQPGSYYLTANITGVSGKHGIMIGTNDVTLDLNSFQMTAASNSLVGIAASNGAQNIAIRNGTLRGWVVGVAESAAANGRLEHLRVYSCQTEGFDLGSSFTVTECSAVTNVGTGLLFGDGCVVTGCLVSSNGNAGMSGGSDCVLSGCRSLFHYNDGIDLGNNFNVSKCTADGNNAGYNFANNMSLGNNGQIRESVSTGDLFGYGITVGSCCSVKECIVSGNGYGILVVGPSSVVMNNNVSENSSAGIASSGGNVIANNQTLGNGYSGIQSDGSKADFIFHNISAGNSPASSGFNYFPTSGTNFASVQTLFNATSSWANF